MSLLIGSSKVSKIFLGTSAVSKIYLGTDIIYTSAPEELYSNAYPSKLSVSDGKAFYNDISWSGNLLTRPSYANDSISIYSFEKVTSNGYMLLKCGDGESSGGTLWYNSHVCTTKKITIPYGVTQLNVLASRNNATGVYLRIGLLPDEAANSMDTANGGVMQQFSPAVDGAVHSVSLASGMNGSSDYRVVINIRGQRQTQYSRVMIHRVYFS